MTRALNQKGLGIVGIIILIAFTFALLNVYSYYNPSFSLSKYSPLNYFRYQRDTQRIKDLKDLQAAINAFANDKGEVPTPDRWCGRISGILHPEFKSDIKPYTKTNDVPFDPTFGNSPQDYFYYRLDSSHYVLMAVLEISTQDTKGKYNGIGNFDFYSHCHDWPGDDVYNYRITNIEF